jgi:hypothetical protein
LHVPLLMLSIVLDACCSHYNGPVLRPFCGWYTGNFSHARRLINPDSSLPVNSNDVAVWDQGTGTCLSKWALRG